MKVNISLIALVSIIIGSAFTFANSTEWKITDNYSIAFESEEPSGVFNKMDGIVIFDANDLANSSFDVSVDVESIDTGNGMQNRHARSDKWFDADSYPKITFKSNEIMSKGDGYEVKGTMEIHGVQKEVSIPFSFNDNVFSGSIMVNRLDYKIGTTEGMQANASTDLKVTITVPVTQK